MKILIDNSNLHAGGGIQVAASFVYDLLKLNYEYEYFVIQSINSAKQIDKSVFDKRFEFIDLTSSQQPVFNRIRTLKKIESRIKPDCIFTVFGPSYHKSKFPKVVGFALPYIIYPESPFFDQISLKEKMYYKIIGFIKTYCFNRNSDALIFESEDAQNIYKRKLVKNIETYTVNNSLNSIFNGYQIKMGVKERKNVNILCLSANYPHKNLKIIPAVIDELKKNMTNIEFKFNISAKKSDFHFEEKYNKYINYIGRVDLEKLPELYESMDLLFMPTLLEVFSTTYLEAMYMQLPIISSDMSFARYICKDASLYCEPTNAKDYAAKIKLVCTNTSLSDDLVNKGILNLNRFGNSMDRTKAYLKIINETIKKYEDSK